MVRSLRLALAGLVAPVWLAVGCSVSFSTNTGASSNTTSPPSVVHPFEPDASDGGGLGAVAEPAETATVSATQGSPLCNASYVGGCYPDLPTTAQACGVVGEGGLASEGGTSDLAAEGADTPLACHVAPEGDAGDAGVAPVCLPAGIGVDDSPCLHGTDCAAGFECVQNACRHYCCAGNTSCTLADFCDVQPMTNGPATLVPVCIPVEQCVLLAQDTCPSGQACQVVREDGTTSCVTVGPAQQGAACDVEHCAAGLVCLGAIGARTCYTLCDTTSMAQCAAGQSCTGGLPLFPNPAVGWCH